MKRRALLASLALVAACGGTAPPAPIEPSASRSAAPAPEGGARSCPPEHFMVQGECVRACQSDADCTDGARCEPARRTTGSVAGSTCR